MRPGYHTLERYPPQKEYSRRVMYAAIINYNMGNIKSVENAFRRLDIDIVSTSEPTVIEKATAVVFPGVGAFKDAMKNLEELSLVDVIKNLAGKKPLLCICIGMQVLFEKGTEDGVSDGLGILKGTVKKIPGGVKIPHMGWNRLQIRKEQSRLFDGIKNNESFYFVHSYHAECREDIISSSTDYGIDIVSSIEKGNLFGVQFHPEKSSLSGLRLLENFWKIATG